MPSIFLTLGLTYTIRYMSFLALGFLKAIVDIQEIVWVGGTLGENSPTSLHLPPNHPTKRKENPHSVTKGKTFFLFHNNHKARTIK